MKGKIGCLLVFVLFVFSALAQTGSYYKVMNDNGCGYINSKGDTVIPVGKYVWCFTDTFKTVAIVQAEDVGFVGIDKNEKILYNVFMFDNGPDYVNDGCFRIVKDGLIGYADADGKIIIEPMFKCAEPFKNGKARVTYDCEVKPYDDEHTIWVSKEWFHIDKKGEKVASPPLDSDDY